MPWINVQTQLDAQDQKSDAYDQCKWSSQSHMCMSVACLAQVHAWHKSILYIPTCCSTYEELMSACTWCMQACVIHKTTSTLGTFLHVSVQTDTPRFHDQLGCRSESELVVISSHKIKLLSYSNPPLYIACAKPLPLGILLFWKQHRSNFGQAPF